MSLEPTTHSNKDCPTVVLLQVEPESVELRTVWPAIPTILVPSAEQAMWLQGTAGAFIKAHVAPESEEEHNWSAAVAKSSFDPSLEQANAS